VAIDALPGSTSSRGAPALRAEEYVRLLDQGIDFCTRWEEWADRQFAALAKGDFTALVSVSARQARMVDAFFRLEYQWQQIKRDLGIEGSAVIPDIEARRQTLLSAAERVFAANYRNLRALNALGLLSAATEPLVTGVSGAGERAAVYDRQGHKGPAHAARDAAVRKIVDREG
jgi:hypothetical protein